jgi:hypothetical protein
MSLALGEEVVTPDEQALVGDFIAFLKEASLARAGSSGPVRRFNQTRSTGCVSIEFTVPDGLPADLRVGLFATPGSFSGHIRFANATSKTDKEQDIRGMSIKLTGVPGVNLMPGSTEQDFVLFSHPVMLAATAKDFLELLQANEAGGVRRITYFATHPRSAAIGAAAEAHHTCHLDIPYFSATPYRFGPGKAVKYVVRPTSARKSEKPRHLTEDYLLDNMRAHLSQGDATFDFCVQFQTDSEKMPIENAMEEWDEKDSPYRKVATIRIPSQAFESFEQMAFAEKIAFNPWSCLQEHQPLGGMNRARKMIYTELAKLRHAERIR